MQPGQSYLTLKIVAAVVIGPLIYAMLIVLWRRLERALVERAGRRRAVSDRT